MSEQLDAFIARELDRLSTQLAAERLSAGDTRLWGVAVLTEAAYCLRAVRAAGLMAPEDVLALMTDAAEIVFSDPAEPVKVITSLVKIEKEGKPN